MKSGRSERAGVILKVVHVFLLLALGFTSISCNQPPPIELTEPCQPAFYLLPPLTDHAGNPRLAIALVARSELERHPEAKAVLSEALATGSTLWSKIQGHHQTQNPGLKIQIIDELNSLLGAAFVLDIVTTGNETD